MMRMMKRLLLNKFWLRKWYLTFILAFLTLAAFSQSQDVVYQFKDGKVIVEITKEDDASIYNSLLGKCGSSIQINDSLQSLSGKKITPTGWEMIYYDDAKCVYQKPIAELSAGGKEGHIFIDEENTLSENKYDLNVRYGVNNLKSEKVTRKLGDVFTFRYYGKSNTKTVYLSGTFNDWSTLATPMKRVGGLWEVSVKLNKGKNLYKFIVDGMWITDPENRIEETDYDGNANSVYFNCNHVFNLKSYPSARRVFLSGNFNDWREKELKMNLINGDWNLPIYLPDGSYSYKFIVDGDWILDPSNPEVRPDGTGYQNSFLSIGKPYVFTTAGYRNANDIILTGSFNDWNEGALKLKRYPNEWKAEFPIKPGNYEYKFIIDGTWFYDKKNPYTIGKDDYKNSILVVEPNHTFILKGYENATSVIVNGTFNGWSEDGYTMKKEGANWVMDIHLPKGKTRYKFIVDGQWIKDPDNDLYEKNDYDSYDSIIWVK
jgi:hypothetical protein